MNNNMNDTELKKYTEAILKAQDMLFNAEYELRKVLKETDGFSEEDKGILLDFMKCYLRTKKCNYDNVEVSVMMRLGGCNNKKEVEEKYYKETNN